MIHEHLRLRAAWRPVAVLAAAALAAACTESAQEPASTVGETQQSPAVERTAGTAAQPARSAQSTRSAEDYTTWRSYAGGPHASQYSALDQINRSNVNELEVAWTFPVGQRTFLFNPVVVGDVMYVLARDNEIVALNAGTGEELWAAPHEGPVSSRGINYWESDDGSDRRLLYLNQGFLTALDAATGETVTSFGNEGRVDLRDGLAQEGRDISNVRPLMTNNPGRVYEDLMIVALPAQGAGYTSTPGNVHAYNVVTGELEWVFHAIPHPGEFGYESWPEDAWLTGGGVHNWSEMTVDPDNGIVFIPFGSPRYDFYGGTRPGDNLYGNSLVALNAATGERLWHYQIIHHDLWDYDLPQAPKLLTIEREGREVEVVAQASKHGWLFVFERLTGEPIWPIEEREVPQSDIPGEQSSPTQPFPTKPPPFAVVEFTESQINPYLTEEEQATVRERLRHARNEGVFTPPSFQGSIGMPGHNGGANWGGGAVDPLNGEFYVVSKNLPVMLRIDVTDDEPSARTIVGEVITEEQAAEKRAEAERRLEAGTLSYASPYEFLRGPQSGLSVIEPPWAHLTAYDLNTGEIKWRVPHGTVPSLGEDLGAHFPRGAPLVTAGGLVFVATASDRMLRAYDRDNGEVVWSYDLPDGSEGIPATYEVNGHQYLALPVAAGPGLFPPNYEGGPPPSGERAYMVFALPQE